MKRRVSEWQEELLEFIDDHNWCLYKIGGNGTVKSIQDIIQDKKPVKTFQNGMAYLFVPKPLKKQSAFEAYSAVKGIGPAFTIQPNDECWQHLRLDTLLIEQQIPISIEGLFFEKNTVQGIYLQPSPDNPIIVIKKDHVIEAFENYFGIVDIEEPRTVLDPKIDYSQRN